MSISVNFVKLSEEAKMPFRATEDSAGADLFALTDDEFVIVKNRSRKMISTGIAVEIPKGYAGFVFPRSSLSSQNGISLANCVGVIDSDYRGEVKVPLINHSPDDYLLKRGDRIAQLVIMPVEFPAFVEKADISELSTTQRGDNGFGSTGSC